MVLFQIVRDPVRAPGEISTNGGFVPLAARL
jgi:hypothetical protein